jgi:plastocyanin
MSIRFAITTIVLVLSVTNTLMLILSYDTFLVDNVFATSEEDENGDSDDDGNDTNGSDEEQEETDNDNNANDVYQVIIPEGAAYRETISERYDPAELHVPSGSTVEWVNEDDIIHTVTSGKKTGYGFFEHAQDGIFNSESLEGGESFKFQFTELGTYEYFCIPHPWMIGVVVVE